MIFICDISFLATANYDNNSDIKVLVEDYLKSIDYDWNSADESQAESYAAHPINAFHLMKRTSMMMPKIKSALQKFNEVCLNC